MRQALRGAGIALLVAYIGASAAAPGAATLTAVLDELRATGVRVLYSSELVTPDMKVPTPLHGTDARTRAEEALAAFGLRLRRIDSNYYVVARATPESSPPAAAAAASAPARRPAPAALEQISVYASRYAVDNTELGGPHFLSSTNIEQVPGSREDAIRATRVLPGMATNGSSRAYIRGSLLDDVLVRFDGVPLADPFHLKNFQSLISAFDTSAVGHIDVFSGGFPVRFGTRSGGVIDISPRTLTSGYEHSIGASLLSYQLATVGHAEAWPVEWLATVRHSTHDTVLKPVNGDVGEPEFTDTLGRVSWHVSDAQAWTLGWLLLDDRINLATEPASEVATARYRDEYVWGAYDRSFGSRLRSRTVFAVTSADRSRGGTLALAGLATGNVSESRNFDTLELHSDWEYQAESGCALSYGLEGIWATSELKYARTGQFANHIASAFGRNVDNNLSARATPRSSTYGLYAAARRHWSALEAELGVRLDTQTYRGFGTSSQVSPRLNIRYDIRPHLSVYGSLGRFTQAQRVDEWRLEEAQRTPDTPELATHAIVGLAYERPDAARLSLEIYQKHWTNVQPYFDNQLDRLSLVPDLQPDRMRLAPNDSDATGVELSGRWALGRRVEVWGSYAWSRVQDEFGAREVPRSWDQPHALTLGLAWRSGGTSASALVGWHRGWPSTPVRWLAGGSGAPALILGARNSIRWDNYLTVDLRAEWNIPRGRNEWSAWVEVTNAGNHANDCCFRFGGLQSASGAGDPEPGSWLPRIVNVGVVWRVRSH